MRIETMKRLLDGYEFDLVRKSKGRVSYKVDGFVFELNDAYSEEVTHCIYIYQRRPYKGNDAYTDAYTTIFSGQLETIKRMYVTPDSVYIELYDGVEIELPCELKRRA